MPFSRGPLRSLDDRGAEAAEEVCSEDTVDRHRVWATVRVEGIPRRIRAGLVSILTDAGGDEMDCDVLERIGEVRLWPSRAH